MNEKKNIEFKSLFDVINKSEIINLEPGDIYCDSCCQENVRVRSLCLKCGGTGKIDWIEKALGKTKYQEEWESMFRFSTLRGEHPLIKDMAKQLEKINNSSQYQFKKRKMKNENKI